VLSPGPRPSEVRLDFRGSPLQVLVWLVLAALVNIKIGLPPPAGIHLRILSVNIPWHTDAAPQLALLTLVFSLILAIAGTWVFAAACRWFCRNLRFSNGATAEFSGQGIEVLGWWILLVLADREWGVAGAAAVLIAIAFFFLAVLATLHIVRWFVSHVELSSNRRLSFAGKYVGLLGWEVLLPLSMLTIIGWAWVLAAMYRWGARNTRAQDGALQFHGVGPEILWRTLAAILFSIPIVTIPWAWLWYTRWLVRSTTMEGPPTGLPA
jgi:hypothetical protein